MYIAKFEGDDFSLSVGAAAFTPPADGMIPTGWIDILTGDPPSDFSIRLTLKNGKVSGVIIIPGEARSLRPPERLLRSLAANSGPDARFVPVDDGESFDTLTADIPVHQIGTDYEGFSAQGVTTVPNFRLLPQWLSLVGNLSRPEDNLTYQINAMAYSPPRETARKVRKYTAALEIISDLPTPVRELQKSIASRLLKPGYMVEEVAGSSDPAITKELAKLSALAFHSDMGTLGFSDPPLTEGSFDDVFATGFHPYRFDPAAHFLHEAAHHVSVQQLSRSLRSQLRRPVTASEQPTDDVLRPVFVSYSSDDFASAQLVADYLETHGYPSWIAPRNIRPGEAYPEAIMRGIEEAKLLVVLVSTGANLSPHVHREVERALHRKLVIVPLRVEEIRPTGTLEYLLSTCHRLDAFGSEKQFSTALSELLDRVHSLLGAPSPHD